MFFDGASSKDGAGAGIVFYFSFSGNHISVIQIRV
jgi:hypothetical protein